MRFTLRMTSLLVACVLLPTVGATTPFEWPVSEGGNGHYYELLSADGMTWQEARHAAESMEFLGMRGHLATISSQAEVRFILPLYVRPTYGAYFGGWQKLTGALAPGETYGWRWLTGESWDPAVPDWCGWGECTTGAYLSVTRMPYAGMVYYWESVQVLDIRYDFAVEYDGMPVVDAPDDNPVRERHDTWGSVKSLFR
ncbi:MAG: hypothetical protein IPJ24_17890 [bacterium]|nr:hypothetical protein [bacterium]